jgi:DNA polymerase
VIVGVDIETYSSVDLTKSGVRPYTEAPDFTILLIAYKIDSQPIKLIDLTARGDETPSPLLPEVSSDIPPGDLREFLHLLLDPAATKTAYNASFERTCLARYFHRPMPPEQWQCTMVQAATMGLPGTLAQVGAILGLERQKMEEGKALIQYFCKPAKDGTRHYPQDAPEKWELFRRYNVRDVDVETTIRERLARWPRPQVELDAWALDQTINDRGVRLDKTLLENALKLGDVYSARLMDEARELTGLDNPRSDAQLKGWLAERGVVTDSLDKKSIPPLLEAATDSTIKRVLRLRQELGKTSISKYAAMERGLCEDGRVHNLLQYYGAGRTGRWAGRLVQVQNLPQNKLRDLSTARQLVRDGEFDLLVCVQLVDAGNIGNGLWLPAVRPVPADTDYVRSIRRVPVYYRRLFRH